MQYIAQLYDIEREGATLNAAARLALRQLHAKPVTQAMLDWMRLQRLRITDNSATAQALDYSLKRWAAQTRFLQDGQFPIRQ